MQISEETKKIISEAKQVCIIPSKTNEPEATTAALALFYTLKEMGKNVNLMLDSLPENLQFLTPSPAFISQPKNFVISIPRQLADISQIYYEKNDNDLKIHLTVGKGILKKEDISFYFSQAKPDVIITLGIQDFQNHLEKHLDSSGFLLGCPIVNIDNSLDNKKYGQENLVKPVSLSEITTEFITLINPDRAIKSPAADCLLAGLIIHYENFQSSKTTPESLQLAAEFMKSGANHPTIVENLRRPSPAQLHFITSIFRNLRQEQGVYAAVLESEEFQNFNQAQARDAVERIKIMGMENDLLVLWKSHNSDPAIRGFYLSKKAVMINKFAQAQGAVIRNGWVFISIPGENIQEVKEKLLRLV